MKQGLLPAAPAERSAEPLQGGNIADRDSSSAIRLLGAGISGGTTSPSQGAATRPETPAREAAKGSDHSELRVGLRMDSIDDDWDLESPAATNKPAVSSEVARPVPAGSAQAGAAAPTVPPTSEAPTGRFGSPLGLASPVVSKPATVPPPAAAPVVVPTQKATPPVHVSKVQLAAKAFRRKAGINSTPSTAPAAKSARSAAAKAIAVKPAPAAATVAAKPTSTAPDPVVAPEPIQAAVIVSPVVEIEEPLELQEISPSLPPPPMPPEALAEFSMQPRAVVASAPEVASKAESVDTPIAVASPVTAPIEVLKADAPAEAPKAAVAAPAEPPKAEAAEAVARVIAAEEVPKAESTSAKADQPRKNSDKAKSSVAHAPQVSHLSLDADDCAVEFFSSHPPAMHFEAATEPDIIAEPRRVTPELIARQQYLRNLVLKVMLIAVIFVAGVVFVLWQRGLLRLTP